MEPDSQRVLTIDSRPVPIKTWHALPSDGRLTEGVFTIDIIINWLATLMIIWRLWRVGHRTAWIGERRTNKYLSIILALVKSGMLFSLAIGSYAILWYLELVRDFAYLETTSSLANLTPVA